MGSLEDKKSFMKEFIERKPNRCSKCKGRLKYLGGGHYQCFDCGNEELDDFGKIKDYVDEHGASPAVVISDQTDVPIDLINAMLHEGRLEIPDGSSIYIECESCGCSIRYGRFCPDCIRARTNNVSGIFFNPDVGEKPKSLERKQDGKMHFINRK